MTRILHASCLSLEGAQTAPGLSDWEGVVSQGGIHRWGWGALCDDASVRGVRTTEQPELHMNHLELLAVFLALRHFCSEGPACPSDDRQFNSGLLHKQAGRDTLSSPVKAVSLSASMAQCSFSVSKSHPCSRPPEPGARPSLQGLSPGEGLEVAPFHSGPDLGSIWQDKITPLCLLV